MSAREELFESMTPTYATQYAPGEAESVNMLLDAYRAEILREAAEEIDHEDLPQTADDVADFCDGARWATAQLLRMADSA